MDWKDIAGTVAKAAPLLGTILGGPAGGAIGGVVSLIAGAFGLTKEEATPEKINSLLVTDPNAALKLAEIEANAKIELQKLVLQQAQLEVEQQKAEFADTASARQRQVESEKATGKRDYNLYILAWTIVLGFYGLIGLLVFRPIPQDQSGVVFMLFGAVVTGFTTILGYFYGSSRGSLAKTQLMSMMKSAPTQAKGK